MLVQKIVEIDLRKKFRVETVIDALALQLVLEDTYLHQK
jgi:hypothetical protein